MCRKYDKTFNILTKTNRKYIFRQKRNTEFDIIKLQTLKVLPIRVCFKIFVILNVSNQTMIKRENKRDLRAYS